MDTHTLTAEEADQVNTVTGFSRDPGLTPDEIEANPGATEGDAYPCFNLPNGERWVFTGAGGFVLVEASDDVEEEVVYEDESPVEDLNPTQRTDEAVSPATTPPSA